MIIVKEKVIYFVCSSCDCEFTEGIHSVQSSDGNYYCCCPMCGMECHTDVAKQKDVNEKNL